MVTQEQHKQHNTSLCNMSNTILFYGYTWATRATPYSIRATWATPYFSMATQEQHKQHNTYMYILQHGQHEQHHTSLWLHRSNTSNTILLCGYTGTTPATPDLYIVTWATPYFSMATQEQHEQYNTSLWLHRNNTSYTRLIYCNMGKTILLHGYTGATWATPHFSMATQEQHELHHTSPWLHRSNTSKTILKILYCKMDNTILLYGYTGATWATLYLLGRAEASPTLITHTRKLLYLCMWVCMYVCMYVTIHRPCVQHTLCLCTYGNSVKIVNVGL